MAGKKKQAKAGTSKGAANDKPVKQAKASAVDISQQHAAKIRDLLPDMATGAAGAPAAAASAQDIEETYDGLIAHGFHKEDVHRALEALPAATMEAALDWLCIHAPPERLPKRFEAGAHAHSAKSSARIIASARAATPVDAAAAAAARAEAAAADRQWQADQAAKTRAERERRAQDDAAAAAAVRARVLAQYEAGSSSSSSDEGGGGEGGGGVEDWELWGDPREIERRRAERKRAAQLEKLSPTQRQEQLALELKTALDQAKAAKASGNGARKRAAGDVIRHIRQEIGANGFKEANIHALIAQRFSYEAADKTPTPPPEPAPPAPPPLQHAAQAGALPDAPTPESDAPFEVASELSGDDAPAPAAAVADVSRAAGGLELDRTVQIELQGAVAAEEADAAPSDEDGGFDLNVLWDDEDALAAAETVKAKKPKGHPLAWYGAGAEADADLSLLLQATTRAAPLKPRKEPPAALPVGVPKAALQKHCHKAAPRIPDPRYNRVSRQGEPYRYSCTIAFPKLPARKKKATAGLSGPKTWQLLESEDGFGEIQDAQNAAALRALVDVAPEWLEGQRLLPPFKELWERWTSEEGGADAEAGSATAAKIAFIESMRQRWAAHGGAQNGAAKGGDGGSPDAAITDVGRSKRKQRRMSPEELERVSTAMREQQEAFLQSAEGQEWAARRGALPVAQVRGHLLAALEKDDFVVLSGDTGCGKTTQVPQYLLEAEIAAGRGAACHVICTQPRRIAAISVAERVAAERAEPAPGQHRSRVGYHVRLDPAVTPDTRLTFCTTGILLRRLAGDAALADVTHVIVDEVHERALQGDFLLALLKRLVATRRAAGAPPLKVVLMSATIDLERLAAYCGGCAALSAKGRTFPVEQLFLEDAYEATGYRLEADAPAALRGERSAALQRRSEKSAGKQGRLVKEGWGDEEALLAAPLNRHYDGALYGGYSAHTRVNLARVDESAIDFDLLEDLVRHIDRTEGEGAILVFLPGMGEIVNLCTRLEGSHQFKAAASWIIPLHSSVAAEDQRCAFLRPPAGVRKVVVATNIAETSLTIEDVVVVVDSGKLKERRFNAARGVSMLVTANVSQASARQRKGRAGRVRAGKCYSLFTRDAHDRRMEAFQVPEVMRVPLEELVLQIHLLDLGKSGDFPGELLQPPPEKAVAAAVAALAQLGALEGEGAAETLTPLGRHLAQLPMEPRLGKLLVTAAFMGCLAPALTIAACLSHKPPFLSALQAQAEVDQARKHLASRKSESIASEQQSEHLVMLAAYDGWRACFERGGARLARDYAKRHCLSFVALQMLQDMRAQFAAMLGDIRLIARPEGAPAPRGGGGGLAWVDAAAAAHNAHARSAPVIKAALVAALC